MNKFNAIENKVNAAETTIEHAKSDLETTVQNEIGTLETKLETTKNNIEYTFGRDFGSLRSEVRTSTNTLSTQLKKLDQKFNNKVIFSAVKTDGQRSKPGQTITYNEVLGNAGTSFNKDTGAFTVQVPGLYMFTFTATTADNRYFAYIYIQKNNSDQFRIWHHNNRDEDNTNENLSGSWLMQLSAKDVVTLYHDGGSNLFADTTYAPIIFTGQLLLPDE